MVKKTNNDLQNTTQKTKDLSNTKNRGWKMMRKGLTVSDPLLAPLVSLV